MQRVINIKNCYLVELPLGASAASGSQINFQDIPQLRGKTVIAIEAFTSTQLAFGPSGLPVVSPSDSLDLLVTLSVNANENVYQVPYYKLISSLNGGFVTGLDDLLIDVTKSYVQLVGGVTTGSTCVFLFYYR